MKFFLKSNESERRYDICKSCDQLSELKICQQCGCFMPVKTKLPMVDCPLKKWDFSNDIDENNPMPEEQKPEDYYKDMIIVP